MNFKIENEFKVSVLFEINVAIGGWTYLIIFGKHINGYYCCVPNWKWGCEMADPCEIHYNRGKLIDCGADKEVAQAIAEVIQYRTTK